VSGRGHFFWETPFVGQILPRHTVRGRRGGRINQGSAPSHEAGRCGGTLVFHRRRYMQLDRESHLAATTAQQQPPATERRCAKLM
jgi:hypothetical protein